MSTANIQSSRVTSIQVGTSMLINEENNAATNATAETPGSGLFMAPSTVTGRAADVTGFLVTAENELGKLEFTDPDGFIGINQLVTPKVNATIADFDVGTVTANGYAGTITITDGDLPAGTADQLVFNNSNITATSTILLSLRRAGDGSPVVYLRSQAAGTCTFDVYAIVAMTTSAPLLVDYVVFN